MSKPLAPFIVVKSTLQPRSWAIVETATGKVVDGGFSSRSAAERYLITEYDNATAITR